MSNAQTLAHTREYQEALRLYRRVFRGASSIQFEAFAKQNGGIDNLPQVVSSLLLISAMS